MRIEEIKPMFNQVIVGGMMMKLTLDIKPKGDLKKALLEAKSLTENILVWTTCPRCKMDVPQIDMTKHGYCYYCYKQDVEAKKQEEEKSD